MGIVQRQGLRNSILTYIGVGLGMTNALILYPAYLGPSDELGLIKLLPLLAVLYAQFSSLGFTSVVLRFFPFFRDKKRRNHGFLFIVFLATLLAFLITTGAFLALKPLIVKAYEDKSRFFVDYYNVVIPLSLFWMWNSVLDAYLGALYKTVVPTFIRGVLIHILNTGAILVYVFGGTSFSTFLVIFVGLNFIPTLLMIGYLAYLKELDLRPQFSFRAKKLWRKMLIQGGFVMLNGFGSYFYQIVDSMMLMWFLGSSGLTAVGVYATMIPIVRVIAIPASSMYKVVYPLIGEHWKNKAIEQIEILYKKVSIINLVMGGFIFMCILINMHILFGWPFPLTGPEWKVGKWIILIIGISRLFDLLTGINGIIITTSRFYRYNTVFMMGILILAPITNLLMIPPYGIIGAAMATTLTSISINVAQIVFVWFKFRIHPFSGKTVVVLLIIAMVSVSGFYLPRLDFFIFDLLYRTIICTVVFGWITLKLDISPDIRNYIVKLINGIGMGKFVKYLP